MSRPGSHLTLSGQEPQTGLRERETKSGPIRTMKPNIERTADASEKAIAVLFWLIWLYVIESARPRLSL